MPTIIDVTPVSSHTSTEPPKASEGRVEVAMARLKFRLRVMAFVVITAAAVAGLLAIGLVIFVVLVGTAAALAVAMFLRRLFAGRPGVGLQPRR